MSGNDEDIGSALLSLNDLVRERDVEGLIAELESRVEGAAITIRGAAADHLGRLKEKRAVPALSQLLLHDENPGVRMHAARALGEIGDVGGLDPLIVGLQDRAEAARAWAALALAEIGDSRAVSPLVALLGDPAWRVRRAAAEALATLRDPIALEPLEAARKRESLRRRRHLAKAVRKLQRITMS